jgi:hypothetical protein
MMHIMLSFVLTTSSVLTALASGRASAEEEHKCVYNDVIGAMGAVAVVHCDHDTPYLALRNDPRRPHDL